jgi:hypothetical protein
MTYGVVWKKVAHGPPKAPSNSLAAFARHERAPLKDDAKTALMALR